MSDTTFSPGTVITSDWLNIVNDHVYGNDVYATNPIYGLTGDGSTEELAELQAAVEAAYGKRLVLRSGATYLIDGELQIDDNIEIVTDGIDPAIIETVSNSGIAIDVGGDITSTVTTTLAENAKISSRFIEVADGAGIASGQLLLVQSNKAWYYDAREQASISPSSDAAGTAVSGTTTTMVLEVGTSYTGFIGKAFTIESGTNAGFARVVSGYDSGTRTVTFPALPDAIDNTSVYRFPQLTKGELHLVRSITGTTVELNDPLMDGYDVVDDTYGNNKEIVTISVYAPLQVSIDNIRVERPVLNGANSQLLRLNYCLNHTISRISGVNGTVAGVQDVKGYNGKFSKLNISSSNDTTTGYGIQFLGSTFGDVIDSDFRECRRGVDISGLPTPSSFCSAKGNRIHGGGMQEDGQDYTPLGSVSSFGIGTHSTSRGALIEGNQITGVGYGLNLRGREERVINNLFTGRIGNSCVYLSFGMNRTIRGNEYKNLYSEGTLPNSEALTETNSFEVSNINNYVVPDFINYHSSNARGFTTISDNVAWGVGRYFLFIDGAGDYSDFSLRNNEVYFTPNSVSDEVALIGSNGEIVTLYGTSMSSNDFIDNPALENVLRFGDGIGVSSDTGLPSDIGEAYTVRAYAADDAVVKIRVGQTGDYLHFSIIPENTVSWIFNGVLDLNSTTMTSMGVQTNVLGLATAPTGTTGTDVKINCHYSGTWLYIENRTGNARNFRVTIYPGR